MIVKTFIIAMSLVMAGSLAIAQGKINYGDKGRFMQHEMMEYPMMNSGPMMGGTITSGILKTELNLTEEQVRSIDALHLAYNKVILQFEEDLSPKSLKLKQMLLEYPVNLDEVKALVMNIARIHGEMHVSMLANRLELEKVLMPIQRIKFKLMHQAISRPIGQGKGVIAGM